MVGSNTLDYFQMGNLYVTEVCNRFEEHYYTKEEASKMYGEKIIHIIPLYAKVSTLEECENE